MYHFNSIISDGQRILEDQRIVVYHFNSIKSYLNKYIIDVWLSATIKFLHTMVGNKYRVVRELPCVSFIKIYDVVMIVCLTNVIYMLKTSRV